MGLYLNAGNSKEKDSFVMKKTFLVLLVICMLFGIKMQASYKVYLIHGIGGLGLELGNIYFSLKENGYTCEIYKYPSLTIDLDSVSKVLYNKITEDRFDTISFVTHSMGGLVVRSLHKLIQNNPTFPIVHRIVMIAPPNRGSNVADFYSRYTLANIIAGPNLLNLTTDNLRGSKKYPLPSAEFGVIMGITDYHRCLGVYVPEINDGTVTTVSAKTGAEKDVAYIEATHIRIIFTKQVNRYVNRFLAQGRFH
jgi:hypothetical protein